MTEVTSIPQMHLTCHCQCQPGTNMRKRHLITQHVVEVDKGFPHPACLFPKLLVLPGVKDESIFLPLRLKQRGYVSGQLSFKPLPARARSRSSIQGCFTSNLDAYLTRKLPKHHREISGQSPEGEAANQDNLLSTTKLKEP